MNPTRRMMLAVKLNILKQDKARKTKKATTTGQRVGRCRYFPYTSNYEILRTLGFQVYEIISTK